jgi:acyl carrier protein
VSADWNLFVRLFTTGTPPLLERLADAWRGAAPGPESILHAKRPDGTSALGDLVRAELAAVLGFRDGAGIGARDRFFELGMDSLTALEFRNGLQGRLSIPLPATLAFDYGSLDLLVAHLATLVGSPDSPAAARAGMDALSDAELVAALTRELDGEPA